MEQAASSIAQASLATTPDFWICAASDRPAVVDPLAVANMDPMDKTGQLVGSTARLADARGLLGVYYSTTHLVLSNGKCLFTVPCIVNIIAFT